MAFPVVAPARLQPDRRLLALICVYFVVFVDILGTSILIPVLPFLVGARPHPSGFSSKSMGGLEPGAAMSIVMFSFNGAQFLSVLLFGPLSDRYGRRPLLILSMIGSIVGYSLQGVCMDMDSFPLFIAARVVCGLLGGTRAVAVAYIADTNPPEKRAKLVGMLALSATLAMQFGPVLGGSSGAIRLSMPCYIAGCVACVGLLMVLRLVPESRVAGGGMKGGAGDKDDRLGVVGPGLNLVLSFAGGFWALGSSFANSLFMPVKYDWDLNMIGLAASADGVCILIGSQIYLRIIKSLHIPLVAALGLIFMSLVAVCPYVDLAPMLVLRYVANLGGPLAIPTANAIISIIAPPGRRGTWTAVTVAASALGRAVAPVVLGLSFDLHINLPFVVLGAVTLAGILACLALAPLVPNLKKFKSPSDVPPAQSIVPETTDKQSSVASSISEKDLEAMSEAALSESAEKLLAQLRSQQTQIRSNLGKAKDGGPMSEFLPPVPAERREAAKCELSAFFVELLDRHGWDQWPEHLDGIKLLLFNSFPPLRTSSREEKLLDLTRVFENHIEMAERSEFFEGAEDICNVFL